MTAFGGWIVLGLACVMASVGCGSDDGASGAAQSPNSSGGSGGAAGSGGDFLGSCDTRSVSGGSEGQCRDWRGQGGPDLSVSCQGLDGTYSGTSPCPSSDRTATCTLDPVLGAAAIYNYYGPTYTADDARASCDGLGGTFRQEAATGSGGATGGGGSSGSGGTTGNGGATTSCPPECFRAYECVVTCGDTPQNFGCCPCPANMIDTIQCP